MIFEAQFLRDNYQFLQVIAYVLGGGWRMTASTWMKTIQTYSNT